MYTYMYQKRLSVFHVFKLTIEFDPDLLMTIDLIEKLDNSYFYITGMYKV